MSFESISPNMQLPVPGVGATQGPTWAADINACLTLIDVHDHSTGSGVRVTPTGLNINTDLSIGSNNLTLVRSLRFDKQTVALVGPSDLDALYDLNGELYFIDGNGNQVQITNGGNVAGTPGSIANLVSPASATYVSLDSTFVWQSDANTPANMDNASIILRNLVANSFGLTLNPPAAMGANFSLTLPNLPVSTSFLTIDTSGNISGSVPVTAGIGTTNIANNAVTRAKLAVSEQLPIGTVLTYAGGVTPPTGYLYCDGSIVSRTTYSDLFAVVGESYGEGDGSTTFAIPDYRGYFLRGMDNGAGRDPDSASRGAQGPGANTGDNVGSTQADAVEAHTHSVPIQQNAGVGPNTNASPSHNGLGTFIGAAYLTGSAGGAENRPINVYVNYIIKY